MNRSQQDRLQQEELPDRRMSGDAIDLLAESSCVRSSSSMDDTLPFVNSAYRGKKRDSGASHLPDAARMQPEDADSTAKQPFKSKKRNKSMSSFSASSEESRGESSDNAETSNGSSNNASADSQLERGGAPVTDGRKKKRRKAAAKSDEYEQTSSSSSQEDEYIQQNVSSSLPSSEASESSQDQRVSTWDDASSKEAAHSKVEDSGVASSSNSKSLDPGPSSGLPQRSQAAHRGLPIPVPPSQPYYPSSYLTNIMDAYRREHPSTFLSAVESSGLVVDATMCANPHGHSASPSSETAQQSCRRGREEGEKKTDDCSES